MRRVVRSLATIKLPSPAVRGRGRGWGPLSPALATWVECIAQAVAEEGE
jgi:hypothetical protein